jgi:hypothetical protein
MCVDIQMVWFTERQLLPHLRATAPHALFLPPKLLRQRWDRAHCFGTPEKHGDWSVSAAGGKLTTKTITNQRIIFSER